MEMLNPLLLHFIGEAHHLGEEKHRSAKATKTNRGSSQHLKQRSEVTPWIAADEVPMGAYHGERKKRKKVRALDPRFSLGMDDFGVSVPQGVKFNFDAESFHFLHFVHDKGLRNHGKPRNDVADFWFVRSLSGLRSREHQSFLRLKRDLQNFVEGRASRLPVVFGPAKRPTGCPIAGGAGKRSPAWCAA